MARMPKMLLGVLGGVGVAVAVGFVMARRRIRHAGRMAASLASLRPKLLSDTRPVVLVQRVRAAIERTVSEPSAIAVRVGEGRVLLHGPVLARDAARLLREVELVAGGLPVDDGLTRRRNRRATPAQRARIS